MQNEEYECANCSKMTTRINYELELPSCSVACDDMLEAVAYITSDNEGMEDE